MSGLCFLFVSFLYLSLLSLYFLVEDRRVKKTYKVYHKHNPDTYSQTKYPPHQHFCHRWSTLHCAIVRGYECRGRFLSILLLSLSLSGVGGFRWGCCGGCRFGWLRGKWWRLVSLRVLLRFWGWHCRGCRRGVLRGWGGGLVPGDWEWRTWLLA
jgi:hypothetical protein